MINCWRKDHWRIFYGYSVFCPIAKKQAICSPSLGNQFVFPPYVRPFLNIISSGFGSDVGFHPIYKGRKSTIPTHTHIHTHLHTHNPLLHMYRIVCTSILAKLSRMLRIVINPLNYIVKIRQPFFWKYSHSNTSFHTAHTVLFILDISRNIIFQR